MDGDRYERQLVNYLDGHQFAAVRMGSSGAGTKRPLPDILAMQWIEAQHHYLWALELKSTRKPHAYVRDDEVEKLQSFASIAGFTVYLAARFSGDTAFYAQTPDDCYRTDDGSYRISHPASPAAFDGVVIESPSDGEVIV